MNRYEESLKNIRSELNSHIKSYENTPCEEDIAILNELIAKTIVKEPMPETRPDGTYMVCQHCHKQIATWYYYCPKCGGKVCNDEL